MISCILHGAANVEAAEASMHQGEEEVSSETLRVGGCSRQMGRMLASPCSLWPPSGSWDPT